MYSELNEPDSDANQHGWGFFLKVSEQHFRHVYLFYIAQEDPSDMERFFLSES